MHQCNVLFLKYLKQKMHLDEIKIIFECEVSKLHSLEMIMKDYLMVLVYDIDRKTCDVVTLVKAVH